MEFTDSKDVLCLFFLNNLINAVSAIKTPLMNIFVAAALYIAFLVSGYVLLYDDKGVRCVGQVG